MSFDNGRCDDNDECPYRPLWTLEHRGFTPTHRLTCDAHMPAVIRALMIQNHGGVVTVSRWDWSTPL